MAAAFEFRLSSAPFYFPNVTGCRIVAKKICKTFRPLSLRRGFIYGMSQFLWFLVGIQSVIEGLTSSSATGKKYSRHAKVIDEIHRVLRLHQSLWIEEAPKLKNETIVFLMRLVRRADEHLFHVFFQELCARIVVIARRWACRFGVDKQTTEDIISDAQLKVLELVLAEQPTRQGDFLEIAFGTAVQSRTLNRFRGHKRSAWAHMAFIDVKADVDMDDNIERPLELTADDAPNPEANVLMKDLIEKAWTAIDDPRILEALVLHFKEGWPIWSKDPNTETVARYLGVRPRQAKSMIEKGLQLMRDAIGEKK